jgi:hypothetical protein
MEKIIIFSLALVLFVLIIWVLVKTFDGPTKLKSNSFVIIDTRGQHIVNETEFVKFMDNLESIFNDNRNLELVFNKNDKPHRNRHEKEKYVDRAAEELKRWIRNTDNYPWLSDRLIKNPIEEELEGMQGENNAMMFDKDNSNKSFDGPHIDKDTNTTFKDIASHVKQIKEIYLNMPIDERTSVNLTETYKLLLKLVESYADSLGNHLTEPIMTIVDKFTRTQNGAALPKMKKHRDTMSIKPFDNGRNNVVVDVSGFRDDDRLATSSNEMERNSAIEKMLVKKSTTHAKLTGGRKHIKL